MTWAIIRARVQAMTVDESSTAVNFILPANPTYFAAHANNHVLHSMLARMFVTLFGASQFTVRGGALVGAALFIFASYAISRLITEDFLLQTALFLCLVFNPLMFDFLVAARGYGLASGFLLCGMTWVAYAKRQRSGLTLSVGMACAGASVFLALSFMSNFSFGLVDAAVIVLLFLWISAGFSLKLRGLLAVLCFGPGFLLTAGLVGRVLLAWPRSQLNYGAQSLKETWRSVINPSFYALNRFWADLLFVDVPGLVLPLILAFALWRLRLVVENRRWLQEDEHARWLLDLAAISAGAVIVSVAAHWIAFRLAGIPLPRERTAIYIVFLIPLSVGALAAVPIATRTGVTSRRGLAILLAVIGAHFLLSLRMSYFDSWKWDADTDKVYSALAHYNHACGLRDVSVNWHYDAALNFYRVISRKEDFPQFAGSSLDAPPADAYVLYAPYESQIVAERGLRVVAAWPSGAILALNPANKSCAAVAF